MNDRELLEKTASRRMVCTEVEDLGEATHEELLAGARRSTARLQQSAITRAAAAIGDKL